MKRTLTAAAAIVLTTATACDSSPGQARPNTRPGSSPAEAWRLNGVHQAMLGIARLHNLALTR